MTPRLVLIRAGQPLSVAVVGGFVRRPAPSDGLVVMMADRDVFLPIE